MPKLHALTVDLGAALNESPSEKEGKLPRAYDRRRHSTTLNESPSEKEGKSTFWWRLQGFLSCPQ